MGAFPQLPKGLEPGELRDTILTQWLRLYDNQAGEMFILEAPNRIAKGDSVPVGLVAAEIKGHLMLPHVIWFPWASMRNRLETAVKFLGKTRYGHVSMIFAQMADVPFFKHLEGYQILRRVGTVHNYYGTENATLFQTKGYTGEIS